MDNLLSFNEFISNKNVNPQERLKFIQKLFNEANSDQNERLNIYELITFFILLQKQWENHGGTGNIDYSILKNINEPITKYIASMEEDRFIREKLDKRNNDLLDQIKKINEI